MDMITQKAQEAQEIGIAEWFRRQQAKSKAQKLCKIHIALQRISEKEEGQYWQKVLNPKQKPSQDNAELARMYWAAFKSQAEGGKQVWCENTELIHIAIIHNALPNKATEKWLNNRGKVISAQKGLLLTGSVGLGKTTAFKRCFAAPHFKGKVYSCIEIQKQAQIEGFEALEKYERPVDMIFDDLGLENQTNHYGTRIDPIHDIMMKRYEHFQNKGVKTHFTTNLNAQEVLDKYGARFLDRLQEMCSFLKLQGKSYRVGGGNA